MLDSIPDQWVQSRRELFGAEVFDRWLRSADAVVQHYASLWGLQIRGFIPGGALSLPLACTRADGSMAVLKISAPWNQSPVGAERTALKAWRGRGAVRILESSPRGDVMLLEYLQPSEQIFKGLDDRTACELITDLYNQLGEANTQPGLPSAAQQTQSHLDLARKVWSNTDFEQEFGEEHFARFEKFASQWSMGGAHQITHGDFQNKNIMLREGQPVVIDPAPAWSDPLMDLANWALIFNPTRGVENRCALLSEMMGLDLQRLMMWVRVQATYCFIFNPPKDRQQYKSYLLMADEL